MRRLPSSGSKLNGKFPHFDGTFSCDCNASNLSQINHADHDDLLHLRCILRQQFLSYYQKPEKVNTVAARNINSTSFAVEQKQPGQQVVF